MWNKLDDQKKNILFFAAMFLMVYIAYVFSFSPTLKAILIHQQLSSEKQAAQGSDALLPQITSKNSYYLEAIKAYHVKNEDHEAKLWQAVSGIALAKNVAINFTPNTQAITDSVSLKNKLFVQQFSFKGSYVDQVKLLDSVSKTKGIGLITELKLYIPKENAGAEKDKALTLQLSLLGLLVGISNPD